ncbi:MAG: RNA ligase family protein [Planctomycetes bacterium]|nr:RNA ligase family protein [Planctomycetota bacterium]
MTSFVKYPRTRHLEGSRLQPGDEDLEAAPFGDLAGRHLVVEEKVDGANVGLGFDRAGDLHLQSRGHALRGGRTERQFDLLKAWARAHAPALRAALGRRYLLFGEWAYAKHTVFYDALPHYLLEFDVLDREADAWLSTPRRRDLLAGLPLAQVPVLADGAFARLGDLTALVGVSRFKSPGWREALTEACAEHGHPPDRVLAETDMADAAEGLYLKWEEDGRVLGRFKWIRPGFLQAVVRSGSHWQDRPILPNLLAPGVDLFGGAS